MTMIEQSLAWLRGANFLNSLAKIFLLLAVQSVVTTGCTGLLNVPVMPVEPGPDAPPALPLKQLSLANAVSFFGEGVVVDINNSTRQITISNLPSGRMHSLVLKEDGQYIAQNQDEGFRCTDSSVSYRQPLSSPEREIVFAKAESSSVQFDLGVRTQDGSLNLDCQTPLGGRFEVLVNYKRSDLAIVSSSMRLSLTGMSVSSASSVSSNGNIVVWQSTGQTLNSQSQILAKAKDTGQISVVSSAGDSILGNGDSSNPKVSASGRWVVFESSATNFVTGAGSTSQIYLKDLQNLNQAPVLVSSLDSTQADQSSFRGNGASSVAQISADGRWLVFQSTSSNFVTGANSTSQIYLKDLQNLGLAPVLVSSLDSTQADQSTFRGVNASSNAQISANGRWLVFQSNSTNFVTGGAGQQIYLKDLQNLSLAPVLASSLDSTQANQSSFRGSHPSSAPQISADGRWLVFQSSSTNFVTGASGTQIYLKDLQNLNLAPVLASSLNSTQANQSSFRGNNTSSASHISSDGRWLVFSSLATNFVTGAGGQQIYLKDLQNLTQAPVLVSSVDSTQTNQSAFRGNSTSSASQISADGRWLVYTSLATNFVTGVGTQQIYLKDLQNLNQAPVLFSGLYSTQVNQSAFAGNGATTLPRISADGRWLVFTSLATNFVTGANDQQIYLKDLQNLNQAPVLVSSLDSSQADQSAFMGNEFSSQPEISADGRWLVFSSAATNFVTGASNQQIYLKDLQNLNQAPVLVSSLDSTQANQGAYQGLFASSLPQVSEDGRWLVFETASSFVTGGGVTSQIYRKDLQNLNQAPVLVSSLDSTQSNQGSFRGNQYSNKPQISDDGRWLVFESDSTNFVTGGGSTTQIYLKDLQNLNQAPLLVSSLDSTQTDQSSYRGNQNSGASQISADGRWIVFSSLSTNLVTGASLTSQIYLKDRQNLHQAPLLVSSLDSTQTDQSSYRDNQGSITPQISADGRWIVFRSSSTNFVTGASGAQIYLKDLQNLDQPPVLVSSRDSAQANQGAFLGNNTSSDPQISEDGRWLAFSSQATNFVTGASGTSQIYLKDLR
jgi:Tol biopolymer transport system component